MLKYMTLAFVLILFPLRTCAASLIPNDCWFGIMARDKSSQVQLVARGPVEQWRVGVPLVLYPTKEDFTQLNLLVEKGVTGTYDTSRPITVVPTWISGPEPGEKDSGADNDIQIMMKYRNAQGETGIITLTYWTPLSSYNTSLPADQQEKFAAMNQQLHDMSCRGVP